MNKILLLTVALSSAALINGCTVDKTEYGPDNTVYSAGFTEYTMIDYANGPISNGFGPAYWSPRYYNGYNNHARYGNSVYPYYHH